MDRRRKHRLTQMRIAIGAILIVALLIGILVVGFHIRKFEVVGNTRHSAEEIPDEAGSYSLVIAKEKHG